MKPQARVHEGIRTLRAYQPGTPIERVAAELGLSRVVKLASNENPLGPSPRAIARIREVAAEMHRYPDGPCGQLAAALGRKFGLAAERLVFGAGSNELLDLALRTFVRPGETVASAAVTFGVYELLAQAYGARFVAAPMDGVAYDLDALLRLVREQRARLVFVANPNNPTGTAFGAAALDEFLRAIPNETVVVYDAAYAEYGERDGIPGGLDLPERFDNVIVTRTFSKAYGLAGLRVGWGVAPPPLADYLQRVRQPFNVSRIAQEAAVAALADEDFVARTLDLNRRGLAFLRRECGALGLTTYPSYANFVLVKAAISGDELFQRMLREGVIIRSLAGFGLPDHVRINTGTDEENRLCADALRRVLAGER